MISVEFNNLYNSLSFNEKKLRRFFNYLFSLHDHRNEGILSVAFLNQSEHSKIHGDFLQDYRPTDVITFPADEANGMVGEICVSVDQAIQESKNRTLSFDKELSLYLIHGWLHLVGFDDKNVADRKIMRREEANAMSSINEGGHWPDFILAP